MFSLNTLYTRRTVTALDIEKVLSILLVNVLFIIKSCIITVFLKYR